MSSDPVAQGRSVAASAFGLLALCGFLFAGRIMISKAALSAGAQPFQLGVLGHLGAGLCLLPWLLASGRTIPAGRRHLILYGVLGLVSVAFPTVLSYLVVQRVGPAYTATVYSLSPLLTMAFAAGLGIERLSLRRLAGIGIGFLGMATLVRQQFLQIDTGQPLWVVFGLAIPASAAAGNIIRSAYWPKGASALAFSCGTLFASTLAIAAMAPVFEAPLGWRFSDPGIGFWTACLIGVSALSLVLNFRLQQVGGPVVFSQIGYWGTGFGVLLAAVLFGDVLTWLSLAGLCCIVAGGVLASHR
ncbi:DMT family transporter [Arenibaculum sp.]|uniref:DMT family transporter n=1 Tax=Arenibaculum sp. TaxID=2865862 RepID=UPI002E0D7CD6|nr:DMT family transporter [Arenibaculum sp.]